jgi:hypothetical protein
LAARPPTTVIKIVTRPAAPATPVPAIPVVLPWQRPITEQGGPVGPIFAAEMVQAFKGLPQPCAVRVTAPDKGSFVNTIQPLLIRPTYGAGCMLWTRPFGQPLSLINRPPLSSVPGVVIQWNSVLKQGDLIVKFFESNNFIVSVSHDLPELAPPNLIWLDFGPGSPWR